MDKKHSIILTEDELVSIRGLVKSERAVNLIEELVRIRELQSGDSSADRFIAGIVELAQRTGKLGYNRRRLSDCPVCGKQKTYARYERTSLNHDKGDLNYDKPIYLQGVDVKDSFIRMEGYGKYMCCANCFGELKPKLVERLNDVKAELPESLMGEPPRWKKTEWAKCQKCEWEGWRTELGKLPTMFGRGDYYGKCPQCGAKEQPFGKVFDYNYDRWTVLEKAV